MRVRNLSYTALVQWPHFFAAKGMGMAQCGQSFVVTGGGGGTGFGIHLLAARTTMKMANATIKKLMIVLMKLP